MLTSDLLRVRRKGSRIVPRYLRGPDAELAETIAKDFVEILLTSKDQSREDIEAALGAVPMPADARLVGLGLRKVLESQCRWDLPEGLDPEAIRREVFLASAKAHRALDVRQEFDRSLVLAEVAEKLGQTPQALDAALYADLRENEKLVAFKPLSPKAVLARYDLGLAQAILLRAKSVVVEVQNESPDRYRRLFRAARFHGLIHVVSGSASTGYTITLDGPFSLFDSVQKYGLRLAMFLPSVLACRDFRLRADLVWGKSKTRAVLELSPEDGLVSNAADQSSSTAALDLDAFIQAFNRQEAEWTAAENEHIFALPGEIVCVPDLVFRNAETGEEVFLEAFGFWSRAAVWQRIEHIRKGFPARILLAVGKQLRVSEEVLGEDEAGEIYVYRATMSVRVVLERLRQKS